jgi:uncharacterized repeat protein (TIGR03803 family)
MRSCRLRALSFLIAAFSFTGFAGVVVNQNVSPGATSWPGSPIVTTVANPSSASVVESFNGGGGNTNLSQTFTVMSDSVLQSISIYAGGGSGTGAGTNVTLRLYDLGSQTAPNPSPYTAFTSGGNLFGGGNGLSISYVNQTAGVLRFDFTGDDQVSLSNGHMYVFELAGAVNTSPLFWQRGISDTYPGGAAYRNRTWINSNNARDFAMAVYGSISVNTNYPPVPYGIVIHIFTELNCGINTDGANPAAGLSLSGGVLYGTTANGGQQGSGTAFSLNPDASGFSAFRSFASAPDAGNPQSDLSLSGNLFFGTTFAGGTSGAGTVFVGDTNGSVSLIRSFALVDADTATNSGGASPSGLLARSGNMLYGTATAGGTAANGTVFSLATNGSAFSVLHNFSAFDSNTGTNQDGAVPWGGLVLSEGKLHGTASAGGAGGSGVIFAIATNAGDFTALHHFAPLDSVTSTNTEGAIPFGGLVVSGNTLYGTTSAGGNGRSGTIYSIGTDGLGFNVLHHFAPRDLVTGTNADGASPTAALLLASAILYGTTSAGGMGGSGTVFSISTNGTQFKTIHSFAPMNSTTGTNVDGAFPVAPLLLLENSLYGTAFSGGPGSAGTLFALPLSVSPAVITNILYENGSVTLFFVGEPNTTNIVQKTPELLPVSNWQNVSTNIADANGVWQFTEADATDPTQFYRSYAQ